MLFVTARKLSRFGRSGGGNKADDGANWWNAICNRTFSRCRT